MPSIYDIEPSELIRRAAEQLKKEIAMPEWTKYVKTGQSKERPPIQLDWYYKRAASILRKIYMLGPIGVNKLRIKYGSKKNRGVAPARFKRSGGKIIRSILQQLEKQGYIKQAQKSTHKGRIITPKGKSFLDKISGKNEHRGSEGKNIAGTPKNGKEAS